MSKKIIIISLLILLTACSNKEKVDDVVRENNLSDSDAKITSEHSDTVDFPAAENLNNVFSLKDIALNQREKIKIIEKDGNRILFDDYLSSTEIISETEAMFSDDYYKTVRNSSQALYCVGFDEGYNKGLISTNISDMKFMYFESSGMDLNSCFKSPYNISKKDTTLVLEGNRDDYSQIKVKDIIYGYSVDNITLNCFIRRNEYDTFDVIIDPAYMHGLPVYHTDSYFCDYTINGLNIKADTLNLNVANFDGVLKDTLMRLSSSYVYAQLTFDKIDCIYGIKSGYHSTASIDDYKLITTDTEKVLTRSFMFESKKEKNPEMLRVYNALMSNMDKLNTELTLGIILLDLDSDNTPEVLVTRYSNISELKFDETSDGEVADVDIYRIENENLKYLGTLYNYHTIIYELGNVLGLKTLEDGSKAWFNMSYKNRNTGEVSDSDYLFTLEGNELKFQEVFSKDNEGNYYYFGKAMVFDESPYIDELDGEERTMYSWGDYKSRFGTWELIGKIKQSYCEDMKNTSFDLYSDWLSHTDPNNKSYKLQLTERMLSFNIAYLVDSFYLGSYDSTKQYYDYRFLGDYAKPVIYLYPMEQEDVSVKVNLNGILTCSYPEYNDGWNVTANPDGTIINKSDGREYSYLYWEGKGVADWDFSCGFVVKGSDTVKILQDKLEYLGLTVREMNEFIVYWLPLMKDNEYNLITFQTTAYEKNSKLDIKPKPDSILRVFMAYKALDKYIEIPEQQLSTFKRSGFTVVEWGGTEVKEE